MPKYYVNKFEPVEKANIVIGECTYGDIVRTMSHKQRNEDLLKIKTIIERSCVENSGKVLIPTFCLDRLQNILTHIYVLFNQDESFDIPILIDTPMGVKITKLYEDLLSGDELEFYKKVLSWKNIKFVQDYQESKLYMEKNAPCVVLSASGMLTAGRSRAWCAKLLPGTHNHILFCGFSVSNSLASQIKEGRKKRC